MWVITSLNKERTQKTIKQNFLAFPLSFAFCLLPFALPKVSAVEVNRQLNIPLNNGTQGEARDEADILLRLGGQEEQKGNLNKALSYWLQALKVYQDIGDDTAIGLTYDYIGLTYASMGAIGGRRYAATAVGSGTRSPRFPRSNLWTQQLRNGFAATRRQYSASKRPVY